MDSHSVQDSLAQLYQRADLGLVIADEQRVIDANEAALRMFGFSREEMNRGLLSWKELTAPEYTDRDAAALEQMQESGACIPFEKEFILRDGTRFPFVIGAVVLTREPLTWAAYLLSLRESRRIAGVEQDARDLKAKTRLVNQLAHELNNPLAGLTFILHVLNSRPENEDAEMKRLLGSATALVNRISSSVQSMLVATRADQP